MAEEKNFLQELHDLPREKRPHAQMITRCLFKRTVDDVWEAGVAIGPDSGEVHVIITFTGETIPSPIYTYDRQPWTGCIWIQP